MPRISAADANTDIPKSKICSGIIALLQIPKNLRVQRTDILHTNAADANTDIPKSKICSDMK